MPSLPGQAHKSGQVNEFSKSTFSIEAHPIGSFRPGKADKLSNSPVLPSLPGQVFTCPVRLLNLVKIIVSAEPGRLGFTRPTRTTRLQKFTLYAEPDRSCFPCPVWLLNLLNLLFLLSRPGQAPFARSGRLIPKSLHLLSSRLGLLFTHPVRLMNFQNSAFPPSLPGQVFTCPVRLMNL